MTLHVVRREIPTPAGKLRSGNVYDTSKWRNTDALVRGGYLEVYTPTSSAPGPIVAIGEPEKTAVETKPEERAPDNKTLTQEQQERMIAGNHAFWEREHDVTVCRCSRCRAQRRRENIPDPIHPSVRNRARGQSHKKTAAKKRTRSMK
jgi:hypothetical protein